jgi:hypothetical protein
VSAVRLTDNGRPQALGESVISSQEAGEGKKGRGLPEDRASLRNANLVLTYGKMAAIALASGA